MQKYLYITDFSDLSQSLKDQLIDTIIEKKFYRGDYDSLEKDEFMLIKNSNDAIKNLHLREEVENELNVNIVINY